jgi:hypothetical protein
MTFAGWVAVIAGWYVTEIGRQPYLVYGVLTTAEAASNVAAPSIATTLAVYLVLYVLLIVAFVRVLYPLARKASAGPGSRDPRAEQRLLNPARDSRAEQRLLIPARETPPGRHCEQLALESARHRPDSTLVVCRA